MTVAAGGGLAGSDTTNDINYSKNPDIYIAYMGLSAPDYAPFYQITTIGYGGTGGFAGSISILQSSYKLPRGSSTNLGKL